MIWSHGPPSMIWFHGQIGTDLRSSKFGAFSRTKSEQLCGACGGAPAQKVVGGDKHSSDTGVSAPVFVATGDFLRRRTAGPRPSAGAPGARLEAPKSCPFFVSRPIALAIRVLVDFKREYR